MIHWFQGCTNFVQSSVRDGEKLGIVKFSNTATAMMEMTTVDSSNRQSIINQLPSSVGGRTSIGAGIIS